MQPFSKKGFPILKSPKALFWISPEKIWKYYNRKEPQPVQDTNAEDTCPIICPGGEPGTYQVDEAFLNRETLREIRQIVDSKPEDTQPPVSLGDEFIEAAGQLVGFADGHSVEIIIDGEPQVFQVYDEELVLALQELEGAGGGDFTFRYVRMDSVAMEIKEIIS